jgi:2-oxoglutarate dehydrogenase E1 component
MIDAPVFHVNGDDPEAVVRATRLGLDYRMTFHKDVVIDLICYRRHGHNEADEPSATQPLMYHQIKNHKRPRELYIQQLLDEGLIRQEQASQLWHSYRELMDQGKRVVKIAPKGLVHVRRANWAPFYNQQWNVSADTSVDETIAKGIARKIFELPEGFDLQKQVKMILQNRQKMAEGEKAMDWGFAELMAYATLVTEGYPVRLTGQDTQRGTFGHRHAILCDQNTGQAFFPLKHINSNQSQFQVYNSLLSEVGAMGFEYGYATAEPNALVIWEAQFGDFANGAQVIIDQFISSAWQKWQRLNGLVLLLPHGYEGQGPEHSSARLERFMQLCAQKNMQVCVPTTPSQIFHLLRRQIHRPYRKPLVVMTPKSLLRNKIATSDWQDLTQDKFRLIIPEIDNEIKDKQVKRVVLCCGKVYYDLLKQRRDRQQRDVAIIRIEQLYPFPYEQLQSLLQHYKHVKEIIWCQEEPQNQGAWYPNRHRMRYCLTQGQTLDYAGREPFAAPAVGYPSLHKKQQQQLIEDALNTS